MRQVAEGPAVEQVFFDEVKAPFRLAFGLRAAWQAGPRFVAVVRGEGQEARVVERTILVVTQDNYLHVVVQAGGRTSAEVVEGADVLADRGDEVLRLDESHVGPPRVAQD